MKIWATLTTTKVLGVMNDDGWSPEKKEWNSHTQGRWPSNVILSHHPDCKLIGTKKVKNNSGEQWKCVEQCPVKILGEQSGKSKSNSNPRNRNLQIDTTQWRMGGSKYNESSEYNDQGTATRFFYITKVSSSERNTDLNKYLATLILPPKRKEPRRLLIPFSNSEITDLLVDWEEVVNIPITTLC